MVGINCPISTLYDLRILKPAFAPRLLALVALRPVRLTFDFLFATSQACLCESLSWLSGLCDTPVRIDGLTINDLGLMRSISIDEAKLAVNISFINHMWQ